MTTIDFGPPFNTECLVCMGYGRVCLCWYDKDHGSGKGVHHGHTPTDIDPVCGTCGGTGQREAPRSKSEAKRLGQYDYDTGKIT